MSVLPRIVMPYFLTVAVCTLVATVVGFRLAIPTPWLMFFGALVIYYSTIALLKYLIARSRLSETTPMTLDMLSSPPTRLILFVVTPLACGLAIFILSLVKASPYLSLPVFFSVLLTGHITSLVLFVKRFNPNSISKCHASRS